MDTDHFPLLVNCVYKGLGIDDMFALVAALENLTEEEMLLPLEEKMGLVILPLIHVKSYISIS